MRSNVAQLVTTSTLKSAQSSRFSLLALEDGEYFLDDFGVIRYLEPTIDTHRKVQGRLKVCTRGLFFVPHDVQLPILRFPFRAMTAEPRAECFAVFGASAPVRRRFAAAAVESMYVTFETTSVVEMKERGVDHPYVHRRTSAHSTSGGGSSGYNEPDAPPAKYIFTLLYSRLDVLLASIHMVYEVSMRRRRGHNRMDEAQLLAAVLAPRRPRVFDASLLVDFREKLLLLEPELVDRIEPLVKYPGCLMLTNVRVYFQPAQINNVHEPVLQWEYTAITQLFKRRHLLRQTGLELVIASGESFFFSCATRAARDEIYAMLMDQPALALCRRRENLARMMHKWQQREVSNFVYLEFLNSAAGRTRNDLTQYPVFPWVLRDYTSERLDLTDASVFRDLSQPIGALNADRLAAFKTRYEHMPRGDDADDGMPPPFLYGTHYSTPGYVLYYLVRLAPQHMLCLQNGKFDAPDRLFRSVALTWQGCVTNQTDLKELIPEFYDDVGVAPEDWLCNTHHLDLGTTQNQNRVDDVELPPWAHGDPRAFVRKHREALESEHVSAHLHEWIDLIFGYKQQGDEAVKANNLFYYLSYEGAIDLETVTDPMIKCSLEAQIQEFGQTPTQLFVTPHPSRNAVESKVQVATPDLLPSPRVRPEQQLQQLRPRRLTYPPPSAMLRHHRRGRKTLAMSSFAFTHDGSDDDGDDDSDAAAAGIATRSAVASRRSLQSGLRFLCLQAPLETVPRALQYSSQLWHTLGTGGGAKPPKKWRWRDRMQLPPAASDLVPTWRWTESLAYSLHSGEITSAVLTRDAATLFTTGKDRRLQVSRLADGSVRHTLSRELALSCCELSPDERLVLVGCWDNCVYMYSARTGRELDRVFAHSDGISAICAVTGYRFITSSWDSTVKLWRYTPTLIMVTPVWTFSDCAESVLCLDASASGVFAAAGTRNGRVYVFALSGTAHAPALHCDVCVSPQRRGDVAALTFAADGNSVVCITMANELLQLSLRGEQLFSMDMRAPGIVRCFASDGEFAVGGTTNGRLFFWQLYAPRGCERVCEIPNAHDTIISSLAVSANGSMIVSGAIDGSVHVWRLHPDGGADDVGDSGDSAASAMMRKSSIPSVATAAAPCASEAIKRVDGSKHVVKPARARRHPKPSEAAAVWRRDASELFRPLSHLYRADLSFTMEESHFFFEG